MNSTNLLNQQLLADWPHRVCLPYGADLLQLARWVNAANEGQASTQFDIVLGERRHPSSGLDVIGLFANIQKECIGNILEASWVICKQPNSIMYFDVYERFSFFSAELETLLTLYPFSREIMWENFALLQEEDDDLRLAEVFQAVQSFEPL